MTKTFASIVDADLKTITGGNGRDGSGYPGLDASDAAKRKWARELKVNIGGPQTGLGGGHM
jgi:hypothetical protein